MPDLKETNVISLLMEVKWRNGPTAIIERHAQRAQKTGSHQEILILFSLSMAIFSCFVWLDA